MGEGGERRDLITRGGKIADHDRDRRGAGKRKKVLRLTKEGVCKKNYIKG